MNALVLNGEKHFSFTFYLFVTLTTTFLFCCTSLYLHYVYLNFLVHDIEKIDFRFETHC